MPLRKVFRHINPLNLLLLSVIAALVFYAYTTFINFNISFASLKIKAPAERQEVKTDAVQTPSVVDYSIIADSNLFHPERIIPPEKKADQLPKPEFILYGTLMTGETKIAYLEDLKAPHSTAGRGKRQRSLQLGQALSGYTLKEVHHDRVLMAKADEVIEVKIGANRKAARAAAAPTPDAATQATQPVAPTVSPSDKPKAGGLPPGVVHTGPPPAGVSVPDEKTVSRIKEAFGSGAIKRTGIQKQTEKPQ